MIFAIIKNILFGILKIIIFVIMKKQYFCRYQKHCVCHYTNYTIISRLIIREEEAARRSQQDTVARVKERKLQQLKYIFLKMTHFHETYFNCNFMLLENLLQNSLKYIFGSGLMQFSIFFNEGPKRNHLFRVFWDG